MLHSLALVITLTCSWVSLLVHKKMKPIQSLTATTRLLFFLMTSMYLFTNSKPSMLTTIWPQLVNWALFLLINQTNSCHAKEAPLLIKLRPVSAPSQDYSMSSSPLHSHTTQAQAHLTPSLSHLKMWWMLKHAKTLVLLSDNP